MMNKEVCAGIVGGSAAAFRAEITVRWPCLINYLDTLIHNSGHCPLELIDSRKWSFVRLK